MKMKLIIFMALGGSGVMGVAIDNTAAAAAIAKIAAVFSPGEYTFTNVETGKTLSFTRDSSLASPLTNVFAVVGGAPLGIQYHSSNAGQVRMSGGNNKCISAQWSTTQEGGVDNAAVSYACAVGSGLLTGTDTLEKTKQWWYIAPIDSATSSDSAKGQSKSSKSSKSAKPDAPSASESSPPALPLSKASKAVSFAEVKTPSIESTESTSSSSSDLPPNLNPNNDAAGVVNSDRRTWICKHPGTWLMAHSSYVTTGGHTECAYTLALAQQQSKPARRFVKKSHFEMARDLQSRSPSPSQHYRLIAVDHLHDQTTRCISARQISTPGGYTSSALDACVDGDSAQRWTVTKAKSSSSVL